MKMLNNFNDTELEILFEIDSLTTLYKGDEDTQRKLVVANTPLKFFRELATYYNVSKDRIDELYKLWQNNKNIL
jgi:aromatic ring-opening dioxygenase LigB subunit